LQIIKLIGQNGMFFGEKIGCSANMLTLMQTTFI